MSVPSIPAGTPSTGAKTGNGSAAAADQLLGQMGDLFSAFLALLSGAVHERGLPTDQQTPDNALPTDVDSETSGKYLSAITKAIRESDAPALLEQLNGVHRGVVEKIIAEATGKPVDVAVAELTQHVVEPEVRISIERNVDSPPRTFDSLAFQLPTADEVATAPFASLTDEQDTGSQNNNLLDMTTKQPVTKHVEPETIEIDDATGQVIATQPAHNAPVADVNAVAPAPRIVHHQVTPVTQVIDAITPLTSAGEGSHTVRIQLSPDNLGELHIKLDLNKGHVDLHIHTDSVETTTVLRDGIDQLRTEIRSLGLSTGSFDVQTGDPREFARNFQHTQRSIDVTTTEDEVLKELHALAQQTSSTSDLDIRL